MAANADPTVLTRRVGEDADRSGGEPSQIARTDATGMRERRSGGLSTHRADGAACPHPARARPCGGRPVLIHGTPYFNVGVTTAHPRRVASAVHQARQPAAVRPSNHD